MPPIWSASAWRPVRRRPGSTILGKALGLAIVCLDARHGRAATALQRNKTDARDAEALAHLVRTSRDREARVEGFFLPLLFAISSALVRSSSACRLICSNQIRSTLETFGLMAGKAMGRTLENRVADLIAARPTIAAIIGPLLTAWCAVRDRVLVLDRRLIAFAEGDAPCGRSAPIAG